MSVGGLVYGLFNFIILKFNFIILMKMIKLN